MKITRVETCQFPLEDGVSTLVFLHTDREFTGVGETSSPNQPETLRAAIAEVESRILGLDPFNVNAIRTSLMSMSDKTCDGILLQVMSGVEAACLDIVGKQLGVSVSQLFGGSLRDEVRLCATRWEKLDDLPEDCARKAQEIAESGFTAIKFDPFGSGNLSPRGPMLERAVEVIRSIREAVGTDIDLIADANGRFAPAEAAGVAKALEPFSLMWLEDPIQTDDSEALEKLAKAVEVPIAVGERIAASHIFREAIERQLIDFVQLDCSNVGGMSCVRDIALLAETYYMGLAIHHSGGPVALAMNAHVAACAPNFVMAEFPYPLRPGWNRVLKVPLELRKGFLKIPSGPGLGVECRAELENPVSLTTI